MRKWGKVLILGRKRWFEQSDALCWKLLKSGQHGAKMTKHADLGLKTLFRTNSCTLLRIANKWCAQCENDKTCWSRANNAVLLFGQTRAICWKELKSGRHSAKMLKRADLGLKTLFCANSCTLLKRVKKWWTQCKNDSTCWSWAENTVSYKLVHFAEKS